VKRSVRRFGLRGSWSSNGGLTLVEVLVTLVILSVLAAVALPYAEIGVRREKEIELRRSLREVRTAIDRFHDDWLNGDLSKTAEGVSEDGFPETLDVLVEGADAGDAKGTKRRYLRRVPRDPFADQQQERAEQWELRGYQDDVDASSWGGKDVFDVRTRHKGEALDGSKYQEW
jgi:general secretion pathway protein G